MKLSTLVISLFFACNENIYGNFLISWEKQNLCLFDLVFFAIKIEVLYFFNNCRGALNEMRFFRVSVKQRLTY